MQKKQLASPWVVTGAAGFLGSHVVDELLKRGAPVLALDQATPEKRQFIAPFAANPLFKFVGMDIREQEQLSALCREEQPAVMMHLAAMPFISAAVRDPALAVSLNVYGTQTVLSACAQNGVTRFFFASTADVYKVSDQPHHEFSPLAPFNIYGLTKLMGEQLVALESRLHPGNHYVVARLFNMYGARETNPHILPEIISQLRGDDSGVLRIGNATSKRDLVPVEQAARALIQVMEKCPPGVTTLNIATGVSRSVEEVVEQISAILGRPIRIETDPDKVRPVERPFLQADVSALRSLIGWTPDSDIGRGLRELLRHEGVTT